MAAGDGLRPWHFFFVASALLALVTCWLPVLALPAGALGIVFAATARQEALRTRGAVPRLATGALLVAATAWGAHVIGRREA